MWFDLRGRNPNIQPNAMNTEDVNDPEVKDVQDDNQAPEANAEQAADAPLKRQMRPQKLPKEDRKRPPIGRTSTCACTPSSTTFGSARCVSAGI